MSKHSYILLSHIIKEGIPSYGDRDSVSFTPNSSISSGGTANSSKWLFTNNHIGTHIDVPRHFSDSGKRTYDYHIGEYVFSKPYLVDLCCSESELIDYKSFEHISIPEDIDLLLIRTGFEKYRGIDEKYWSRNPGLNPSLAEYFRGKFPNLNCVGFDFISVTSWQHRAEGKLAHRAFLAPENGQREIRIIEDMSLAQVNAPLEQVIVAPILCEDGNGGAVTVIGKYYV